MKIFAVLSQGIKHCVKSVQIQSYFWCAFSCTRTEYGDLLRISPYSIRVQENTDLKKLPIWTLFKQWNNTINDWSEGSISSWTGMYFKLTCVYSAFSENWEKKIHKLWTNIHSVNIKFPQMYFCTNLHKKIGQQTFALFFWNRLDSSSICVSYWIYVIILNRCWQFNALVYLFIYNFLVKQSRKNQVTIHKDLVNQIIYIILR